MSWTLAITGKGGVGKTTLAALAVRWLTEHGHAPVLAVDADPNICLDALLGVQAHSAVGSVREEVRQIAQAQPTSTCGMGKQQMLEMRIQQSLVEADRFDLVAMGRPEGPGCYCYANNVLGAAIRRLAKAYKAVVIDNEAGLENLSRRIVQQVDYLLFVADPSARGITTAKRLYELAVEMRIDAGAMGVVVNRMRDGECLDRARGIFDNTPVRLVGGIPESDALGNRDAEGEPVWSLPEEDGVYIAASAVLGEMISG